MILFSQFDPSAWTESGPEDDRILVSPEGDEVRARSVVYTFRAVNPDTGSAQARHVPFWLLHQDKSGLGRVFQRSHSPLNDLRHALHRQEARTRIEARLQICALSLNLAPGLHLVNVEHHCVTPNLEGESRSLTGMPSMLAEMVQHVRIVQYAGCDYLNSGEEDFVITVPSSRHAVMERFQALTAIIGSCTQVRETP